MFLTHDRLVILRDMGDVLIASCEGVVGWIRREDVQFDAPLSPGDANMPISSSSSKQSLSAIANGSLPVGDGAFKSIVVSPSPPQHTALLPEDHPPANSHEAGVSPIHSPSPSNGSRTPDDLSAGHPSPLDLQRISNQFDLESPLNTPGSSQLGSAFVDTRNDMPGAFPGASAPLVDGMPLGHGQSVNDTPRAEEPSDALAELAARVKPRMEETETMQRNGVRESMASMRSDTSSALGGIGGLLMGGTNAAEAVEGRERMEELSRDMAGMCLF